MYGHGGTVHYYINGGGKCVHCDGTGSVSSHAHDSYAIIACIKCNGTGRIPYKPDPWPMLIAACVLLVIGLAALGVKVYIGA